MLPISNGKFPRSIPSWKIEQQPLKNHPESASVCVLDFQLAAGRTSSCAIPINAFRMTKGATAPSTATTAQTRSSVVSLPSSLCPGCPCVHCPARLNFFPSSVQVPVHFHVFVAPSFDFCFSCLGDNKLSVYIMCFSLTPIWYLKICSRQCPVNCVAHLRCAVQQLGAWSLSTCLLWLISRTCVDHCLNLCRVKCSGLGAR